MGTAACHDADSATSVAPSVDAETPQANMKRQPSKPTAQLWDRRLEINNNIAGALLEQ
jgi:hypothetical protein